MSKQDFEARDYSVENFKPSTGLGCFDAKYFSRSGKLEVKVTACPRFTSGNAMRFDENEELKYLRTFTEFIPDYWNNKFRIRCTKKDWTDIVAEPTFEMEIKKNITDAHYDLKILGSASGNIAVRQAFDIDNPVSESEQRYVRDLNIATKDEPEKFAQFRGKQSAVFNMNAISANIATQSKNMLNAISVAVQIAINTDVKGPGQFSIAAMERLRTLARDVEYIFQQFDKPKITITAASTDDAKKVGKILAHFGSTSKQSYSRGGEAGKVRLEVDNRAIAKARAKINLDLINFAEFAQYAAVHEYGHMLALPDEYMCCGLETVGMLAENCMAADSEDERETITGNTTTDQQEFNESISKSQKEFIKLCSAAGVVPPPFGRSNPSLMSSGHEFLAAHAVTIWKALSEMTDEHIKAKEWQIDLL